MDAVYPGKAIIEGGQTSTGSVIAWFKRNFAPDTSFEEPSFWARSKSSRCFSLIHRALGIIHSAETGPDLPPFTSTLWRTLRRT
jgi:ribulose kinase